MENIWKLKNGTVITQVDGDVRIEGDSEAAYALLADREFLRMGERVTSPSSFVRRDLDLSDPWSVHCWIAEKAQANGTDIDIEPNIEKPKPYKTEPGKIY